MANSCSCAYYPTIVVPGIGDCKAFEVDDNGNRLRAAWPPDIDKESMSKIKRSLALPAIRMMVLRHDLGFTKKTYRALSDALEYLKSNPDGTYKRNIQTLTYDASMAELPEQDRKFIYRMLPLKPLADIIGEDHLYYFAFVPIGNAYEAVERLRAFIKMVKVQTGHDKVNLAAVSMGGSITTAYLDAYGADGDVHRVVGVVPAFNGSIAISDIMQGKIDMDDYESLFKELMGRKNAEKITNIVRFVPKKVLKKFIIAVIDAVIDSVIVNATTMWGVVPAQEYEALRDKHLSDDAHAALREQTDRAWRVRADLAGLVKKQKENGIDMFSLCGYNVRMFKALTSADVSSDMIVDTYSASLNAHIAPLGQTLGDNYKQRNLHCTNAAHNHISPDNTVDASCGALPDTTWYFRDMEHEEAAVNEQLLTLMKLLLCDDTIKDIYTDPAYPQFNVFVRKKKEEV